MGLQEALNRVENVVPYGFLKSSIPSVTPKRKRKQGGRGFLSMTDSRRFSVQSKGGKKAHKNPKHLRCHEFTSEEARKVALKRWGKR